MKKIEQTLLFLTLLFLPTQLGRHFWPDFSLVYSLRIDYLSPTIYFWDLLVLSLVSIRIITVINWTALNLLLFFLLSQLISLLPSASSGSIGIGLVRFEQYVIAGFFGVYIASLDFKKVKNIFFWALTLAVLIESVLAIAQFLRAETLGLWILGERTFSISTPAIAKFDFYSNQFLRPYATFPHPNVLAAFLVLSIVILNSIQDLYRFRIKSGMTMITTFLAGLAIALTVSRAAILVGVFSALVLLKRKWLILFLLGLLLISPYLYPRFSSVLNFDNLTLLRREQLSKLAFQMWSSSPIFGIGLNNFILSSAGNLVIGPSRFLQPVHNIFLLSLVETGVIGVIGVIGLIGYPIYRLIKGKFEGRKVLLTVWGLIIFLGMFDHYFLTLPQGYRILFLIWGLSISIISSKITTNAKPP